MLFRSLLSTSALLLLASPGLAANVFRLARCADHDVALNGTAENAVATRNQALEDRALTLVLTAGIAVANSVLAGSMAGIVGSFALMLSVNSPEARGNFTREVVEVERKNNPHYNWVIIYDNIEHTSNFEGEQGVGWESKSVQLPAPVIGPSLDFILYAFKAGEFTLHGDGGFENWAYIGNTTKVDQDGKHVVFVDPAPESSN